MFAHKTWGRIESSRGSCLAVGPATQDGAPLRSTLITASPWGNSAKRCSATLHTGPPCGFAADCLVGLRRCSADVKCREGIARQTDATTTTRTATSFDGLVTRTGQPAHRISETEEESHRKAGNSASRLAGTTCWQLRGLRLEVLGQDAPTKSQQASPDKWGGRCKVHLATQPTTPQ